MWLTTKQVAELESISERTVRRNIEHYTHRRANGAGGKCGTKYEIALESLPQKAQDRYHGVEPEQEDIQQYTGKQREEADAKAWIVVQYRQSGLSPEAFVSQFNATNPPEDAITTSKLFRWHRKYGYGNVAALIDRRGGHNRGQDTIPEDAWQLFYALYMTQQQRAVSLCYDVTKLEYPDIPSKSAFERKVRQIPYPVLVYYREGPKAYKDKCLPYMERSKLDLASNDVWFSDHHLVDVFVKSADGKRAIRPWITVFFDARSNKVVSTVVRNADPNATVVKTCFRLGVEQNGTPNEVYFDNGKDYRSKYFSRDYPLSLVNQLGIGMIYATPYHGQAKTVERFFNTFTNRFSRRFKTYTGSNAKIRPECMQTSNAKILEQAPELETFIQLVQAYIEEYNNTPSSGIDLDGKCPEQVYHENLAVKRVIRDHDALRLLCGNSEERTVHKNGVSILNNHYYHELLASHVGERVVVVYDPDNIDKINIFDMENRAICVAEAKIRTPFRNTTEEDYIRAAKEKKAARRVYKQYQPSREMDIHSIIARYQSTEKAAEDGDVAQVDYIAPQATANSAKLKSTERSRRLSDDESVSATLLKSYEQQA